MLAHWIPDQKNRTRLPAVKCKVERIFGRCGLVDIRLWTSADSVHSPALRFWQSPEAPAQNLSIIEGVPA